MRVAHYLIRGRSGLFYFRLRVPQDLRALLGLRLIKRALGTRCPRTALACAVTWAARYAHAFATLRRVDPMTKPPSWEEMEANLRAAGGRRSDYVIQGPGGFRIEATDDDDHARAMDALENIGRIAPGTFAQTQTNTPAHAIKRMTLKDAMTKWEKAIKNTDPKTIGAKKRAVQDLLDWKQDQINAKAAGIGGKGASGALLFVDEIDGTTCGEWFIHLNAARDTKGKPRYSPGTMENKFIYAAGFFDWAITNKHYPKGDNPARGHANVSKKTKKQRAKSHGAQAFDPEQIETMFQPDNYRRMRSRAARWAPLLLLYTGARSNEIGRLELADIYEHPKGCQPDTGTKVLCFTVLGDDKKLKTDESYRLTPIHPHLIQLGFWDYVVELKTKEKAANEQVRVAKKTKAPDDEVTKLVEAAQKAQKLFSDLTFDAENGPANAPQSAFRRMLKLAGIKARGEATVGHHSFRDTVIDKMKQSGVTEEMRHEYTGHKNGGSENADAYEHAFSPERLAEICHPALDWRLDLEALKPLLLAQSRA